MNQRLKQLVCTAVFLGVALFGARSHAAGSYKFCARWQYSFGDQNLSEDYFKYTGTSGVRASAYAWAILQRNNVNLWAGYLDASGCTPVHPSVAGNYTLNITAGIKTPSNAFVTVTPTNAANGTRWFTATWNGLTANTTVWTLYANLGNDTTAGAIALATSIAAAHDGRFVSGHTYKVYTEMPGFVGHYSPSEGAVHLGVDEYTNGWVSLLKSVVTHELGHAIQHRLFGFQASGYNDSSPVALCTCDHIDHAGIRSHCMQSRELTGAAQSEGFAHFIGAALFNNPAEEDAFFPYYKELRMQAGGPDLYPPVGVSAYYPSASWHWMEAKGCAAAGRGTEIDWMNFYYQVHTKTANKYSFADIANIYQRACGGVGVMCTASVTTSWTALQNAVNARFGAASAKAQYWAQVGDWQGVNW